METLSFLSTTVVVSNQFDFDLFPYIQGKKVLLLTDHTVESLWQRRIMPYFDGCTLFTYTLAQGEGTKNLNTVQAIYSYLQANRFGRDDLLVAFGGGVISDIGGFVAATYMRGIGYYGIPTTLLSQVDSAYGGKCGVNFGNGKNGIGCFYLPHKVYVSTEFLSTVSHSDLQSGLCELLKYGFIFDNSLFSDLETAVKLNDFTQVVVKGIESKKYFVTRDLTDKGIRGYLNFGHTIGHGIEVLSEYNVPHGLAVGAGMFYAAKLGVALGITPIAVLHFIQKTLESYNILYKYGFSYEQIYDIILLDKKTKGDCINLVLLADFQQPLLHNIPLTQLKNLLKEVF